LFEDLAAMLCDINKESNYTKGEAGYFCFYKIIKEHKNNNRWLTLKNEPTEKVARSHLHDHHKQHRKECLDHLAVTGCECGSLPC
jgi:hypothetical protein